jgi:hypothetical protein
LNNRVTFVICAFDYRRRVSRELLWIEVAERATVALALVEHGRPVECRLRPPESGTRNAGDRRAPAPPFAIVHQHPMDVDAGTPLRLRIRHAWRLHDLDKTEYAVWRGADINRPISKLERQKQANRPRGVRDTCDELSTGWRMRTLMTTAALVYARMAREGNATRAQHA